MAATEVIGYLLANLLVAGVMLTPALVAVVAARRGIWIAAAFAALPGLAIGSLASGASGSLFAALSAALPLAVGFGGLGLVLWYYGGKSITLGRLFAGFVAYLLVGTVGLHFLLHGLTGVGPVALGEQWFGQIGQAFDQYLAMMREQIDGARLGDVTVMESRRFVLVWTFFRLSPSFIVWLTTAIVLANVLIVRHLLPSVATGAMDRWRAPDALVWSVLAPAMGLLPYLVLQMLDRDVQRVTTLFYTSLNAVLVALVPYAMQGLGVMSFFMKRWRLPRFLRGLTYFMVVTQGLLPMVPVLGLVDFWTDWRGRAVARSAKQTDEHD